MMTDEVLSHGTAERMLPEQHQLVEALTFERRERHLNVSVHVRAVEYFSDDCAYRIEGLTRNCDAVWSAGTECRCSVHSTL